MANIKSAKKRAEIAERNAIRNAPVKKSVKTSVRKFNEADTKENAATALKETVVTIDKAVAKGVLHKNAAARKKSRLAKKLNKMA
ncbi:MAG TPA: 30S ribosomal protein S20 [Desulfobacteria bacterium]|nr:30S ribosomal protein S20 [Desulfobacteria bacterium]